MDLGLRGKSVLVTGGAKGIGSGISEVFAQEGANVAVVYHSDAAACEAFAARLAEQYGTPGRWRRTSVWKPRWNGSFRRR